LAILRTLTAVAVESEASEADHARAAHAVARALAAQMTAVEGDGTASPQQAVELTNTTVVATALRTALREVQQSTGPDGTQATHDATVAVASAVCEVNALYVRTAAVTTVGGGGAVWLAAAAVATTSLPRHVQALVWGGGSVAQLEASTAAAIAHAAAGVLPVESVLRLGQPPSTPSPPLMQSPLWPTLAELVVRTAEDDDDDEPELLLPLLLLLPAVLVIGLAVIIVATLKWGCACCVPCLVMLKRRWRRASGDEDPTPHDDDVVQLITFREGAKVHPLHLPGNVAVPNSI
jgi:hypothetical protein